jgi:NDP-sugar pyrophosphorylase family protein
MILAAGFGTRLRPLTDLRAKPALPVRGRPVISLLLELLARYGFRDVMINLHHLPETIRSAVAHDHPAGLRVTWSEEPRPLGTGGGIRRAADFLRQSSDCVVLAGDMLLDLDLAGIVDRHRASGRAATLVLRNDSRARDFGTIGVDASGQVNRIGKRLHREGEQVAGLFTGVRVFSREMLDDWPDEEVFEDLRDWLVPAILERGARVGGEILDSSSSVWEPVGTLSEYLRVNIAPPELPSLGGPAELWSGDVQLLGEHEDLLVGSKAVLGEGVQLDRAVVWDSEQVPPGFQGSVGVFAGGRFHACADTGTGSPS